MNPVLESLFKHQSIRKYKDQPVEDEKLQNIFKAAQAAPNWCNAQHVSIVAVKDPARKQKLCELCLFQPYIASCPVFLIFCADFYRTAYIFEKNGVSAEQTAKYMEQLDTVFIASHDCGIAMENAIVAAESMGLGTVPIGAVRKESLEIVKMLNLPKYVIPIVGLCVGYPDDNPGVKPRLPTDSVCFIENYDADRCKSGVEEFDVQYQKYLSQRDSNSRDENWSNSVIGMYIPSIGNHDNDYPLLKQQVFISIEKKN